MSRQRVLAELRTRMEGASAGDRLPTVRALMRELRVSQAAVQAAFRTMSEQGLVTAHVGRGTFVSGKSARTLRPPTALVLSARTPSHRNRRVADLLLRALSDRGARGLQVVYDQLDHAMEVLEAGLAFDVVVLQSHLETVPIRLLDFLQKLESAVIIDGSRLSGIDVDIVSTNWPASLDLAVKALRDAGHRRIGFVTWPSPARSVESLRQHFDSMRRWAGWEPADCPLILLDRSPAIGEPSGELVRDALRRLPGPEGKWPVSALAIWCGNEASGIAEGLDALGLRVPDDLSVVVVGHADVEAEHLGRFAIAGPRTERTAELLADAVFARAADPLREVRTVYVESTILAGASIWPV